MPATSARKYLNIIRPPLDIPDVASFSYPGLEKVVQSNYQEQFDTADEIFERYDADDEEALDLRLSHEYLLISALKLQNARNDDERQLWSERYTLASVDIFGSPDVSEAAIIAAAELPMLMDVAKRSSLPDKSIKLLIDSYSKLAKLYSNDSNRFDYHEVIGDVKKYLYRKYSDALAELSGDDDAVLDFMEINRVFNSALSRLGWEGWTISNNQTAQMSVSPQSKTVNIGKYIPNLTLRRVRALFAHEVLTHAQRAVNGSKIDINLRYGLPGYLTSEEGLGVVLESSIEGTLPNRVADRYIDISLALGLGGMDPVSRFDLFRLTVTRMLLRLGPEAEVVDRAVMRRIAWQHVNRIYRGSLGNEFVGVFTRDIAYYEGFKKMIDYLRRYQHEDFDDALEFALSGKFDPINDSHRLYVHKRRFGIDMSIGEVDK